MFTYIKRFFFLIVTNIAVMIMLTWVLFVVEQFFPGFLSLWWGQVRMILIAAVIGFGGAIISLFLSKYSAKMAYNITLVDSPNVISHEKKVQLVYHTVERIAKNAQIVMPEVGVYESPEPNAFATGPSKNNSLVAVSTGLLELLDEKEIEWVVGHEMAHILNGDMVTLTLIQGVLNTFVFYIARFIGNIISSNLSSNNNEEWNNWWFLSFMIVIALEIVFGLIAQLVVMYFSRIREYRADLWGAQYTSKSSMIAGLKKLKTLSEKRDVHTESDPRLRAFMITEPDSFFSTHPSLDNRIKALEENYQLP